MILIPLITLLIFFIFYQKKNKGDFGIISLLILTYSITSILGAILYYSKLIIPVFEISFISMLYFSALTLLLLIGFSPYKDNTIHSIVIDSVQLLNLLERFLLFGSIFSILFFLPYAFKAFQGNILENRLFLNETSDVLRESGLVNSFASLFANLFMLTQMFFFINLIRNKGSIKKGRAIIMLLASMSYFIYVSAYVGRDGMVFWIMSFIFQYLFFKKFIAKDIRKAINKTIMVFSILLAIPFMLISIARFSESPQGVYLEIINYMGQQLINFSDKFDIEAPLQLGTFNFPVFTNFFRNIGFDVPMNMDQSDYFSYYLDRQVQPWTFSTLIGSFLIDFGKLGTIIFIALFSLVTYRLIKKSLRYNSFPISNFVLLILMFQTVYFGVFYFRLYSANYYIIAVVIIYIIFKIKPKKHKSLAINLV